MQLKPRKTIIFVSPFMLPDDLYSNGNNEVLKIENSKHQGSMVSDIAHKCLFHE